MPTLLTNPEFQFGERIPPPLSCFSTSCGKIQESGLAGAMVEGGGVSKGHLLFLLKKEQLPQISQNEDLGGGRGAPFGHLQTEDYRHLTLRSASFSGFVWQQL